MYDNYIKCWAPLGNNHLLKKLFTHLENKYLLSNCYELDSILDIRDVTVNNPDKNLCPRGAYVLVRGVNNKWV